MPSQFIKPADKSGHKEVIGETIAKLVLFKKGYNVYSRFLDIDSVDMIIRIKKDSGLVNYDEIQLKYSKYYPKNKDYWFKISKSTFEARKHFYFMFICHDEDTIFTIPSIDINSYVNKFYFLQKKGQWDIHIVNRNNNWYFTTKQGEKWINITGFLNNFDILKSGF